jgi:hypothetical protein
MARVSHVFRNPLIAIPKLSPCPSSPGFREPISVAIPSDLLKKNGALMQNANVSHGKPKMNKGVSRRELPYNRRLMPLYRGRVVRGAALMSVERKKKVVKKQRRSKKKI